jgi:hypothetical protein
VAKPSCHPSWNAFLLTLAGGERYNILPMPLLFKVLRLIRKMHEAVA